mgnify:CR=1 FL=1
MSWRDELISTMRAQGAASASPRIQLGKMTGASSAKIGALELDKSCLLFFEHDLKRSAVKVQGRCADGAPLADSSEYLEPLQAGDTVALYALTGADGTATRYIVLGKVVAAT